MKFKKYNKLNEEILQEFSNENIASLIVNGNIPLDHGMMKRLGFSKNNQLAYHVTNYKYLDKMVKNQNKKKQISCFTKGGSDLMELPSDPNVLLMLKGDLVIEGSSDLWTIVSSRSRRWLAINSRRDKLYPLVQEVVQNVSKLMSEFENDSKFSIDAVEKMSGWSKSSFKREINELPNKHKIQLYRFYMDEMEKMLRKHSKVFIDYLHNSSDYNYNEVVFTRWEILDSWIIEDEDPHGVRKLSKLGIPYTGIMSKSDLAKLKIG